MLIEKDTSFMHRLGSGSRRRGGARIADQSFLAGTTLFTRRALTLQFDMLLLKPI